MSKVSVAVVVAVLMATVSGYAGLYWGSGVNVIYNSNGSTPLATSDSYDPTAGAFAQLIRILVGTDPYGFTGTGNGTSAGNESVMAVTYSGQNDDLSDPGTFQYAGATILANSSYDGTYYIRFFNAPTTAGEWADNMNIYPTAATHYNQTVTYAYTHNESVPSTFQAASGSTTTAIPEPATLALVGLGALGLRLIKRRKA